MASWCMLYTCMITQLLVLTNLQLLQGGLGVTAFVSVYYSLIHCSTNIFQDAVAHMIEGNETFWLSNV
jgi:hypothetical protein